MPSEIRSVRARRRSFPKQFMRIFGTYIFLPFSRDRPVSTGTRPGHREDTFIFNRKSELQSLALIVAIDGHSRVIDMAITILFLPQLLCFLSSIVIDQPVTL